MIDINAYQLLDHYEYTISRLEEACERAGYQYKTNDVITNITTKLGEVIFEVSLGVYNADLGCMGYCYTYFAYDEDQIFKDRDIFFDIEDTTYHDSSGSVST